MNTPRILLLLLAAAITRAQAQDNPTPAPATEPAQTEMQKWIATTDAQWQAGFNRDVVDIHAADIRNLAAQYAASVEAAVAKASAAGDLEGAVALRNERKRFAETNVFPEQDEAADAASVKQIRAATRLQLARVEKENAIRTKALHAKYDAILAQAQTQLTQAKRLDDALLVKAKREEVAAAWITLAVASAAEKANLPAAPATNTQKPATIAKVPFGSQQIRDLKATIPANSPDAFPLGDVRKGTKISLKYTGGKWKSFGRLATNDPDDENLPGGEVSRLVIALPSKDGKGGKVLAVVPANTKKHPFVFEVDSDYQGLVLRINDTENSFAGNPGSVEYSVKVTPPGR